MCAVVDRASRFKWRSRKWSTGAKNCLRARAIPHRRECVCACTRERYAVADPLDRRNFRSAVAAATTTELTKRRKKRVKPRRTTSSSVHIRGARPSFSRRRGNCGTHVRAFFRGRPPTRPGRVAAAATITQRDRARSYRAAMRHALTAIIILTGKSSAPLSPMSPMRAFVIYRLRANCRDSARSPTSAGTRSR